MDLLEEELNWLNCIDYNLYEDHEFLAGLSPLREEELRYLESVHNTGLGLQQYRLLHQFCQQVRIMCVQTLHCLHQKLEEKKRTAKNKTMCNLL